MSHVAPVENRLILSFILSKIWCSKNWRMPHNWQGLRATIPFSRRPLSLPRSSPQYATNHRLPIARQPNLLHHPAATGAPGIWHITCRCRWMIFLMGRLHAWCRREVGLKWCKDSFGLIRKSRERMCSFRYINYKNGYTSILLKRMAKFR